jgi:hypothetical protein
MGEEVMSAPGSLAEQRTDGRDYHSTNEHFVKRLECFQALIRTLPA